MKTIVGKIWTDPEAFRAACRAAGKYVVALLGVALATGLIPADGLYGKVVGVLIGAGAVAFPTISITSPPIPKHVAELAARVGDVEATVRNVVK